MTIHDTPIGALRLAASDAGITVLAPAGSAGAPARPTSRQGAAHVTAARHQLDAYFAGSLREFTVPVDLGVVGPTDRRILEALAAVGFGTTTSYGELAKRLGMTAGDARRIGGAMARNPVLVVVPCHRVLGADGSLVGYSGGLPAKQFLLDLESAAHTPTLALLFGQ